MPTLSVITNVPRGKIPDGFVKEATDLVAKLLGKPASYVAVYVIPDTLMMHGGSDSPCASLTIASIGSVSGSQNKKTSAALSSFIQQKLGIPIDRFYINFYDLPAANVGWNGGTFA